MRRLSAGARTATAFGATADHLESLIAGPDSCSGLLAGVTLCFKRCDLRDHGL
jgi:hypothetical protein